MGLFNYLFARAAKVVFNQVDRDKDGKLDALGMMLLIYHECGLLCYGC